MARTTIPTTPDGAVKEAKRTPRGQFPPGQSGNPGGRPRGLKVFSVRKLFGEAFNAASPKALKTLIAAFSDDKRHLGALELAARVNKEIGLGSDAQLAGVTIVVQGIDPQALRRGRSIPLELPATSPVLRRGLEDVER